MPEEQWKIDVSYNPDSTAGPWFRRKKWNWSVWHWRPDETADYRFDWARTKEDGHRAAVKAQIEMENNIHIVKGVSSGIYEAAREAVAAYTSDDAEGLAVAIFKLDEAIERGRVMEMPPWQP